MCFDLEILYSFRRYVIVLLTVKSVSWQDLSLFFIKIIYH